jgi:hypothetical protein
LTLTFLDRRVLTQIYPPNDLERLFKAEVIFRRYVQRKKFKALVSTAYKSPYIIQVRKRLLAVNEILSTEQSYVNDLQNCLQVFTFFIIHIIFTVLYDANTST